MGNTVSQTFATSQFFFHGRRHFTQKGYTSHCDTLSKFGSSHGMLALEEHSLDLSNLQNKTIIVTGANAGLGKEISRWLLANGAVVYMACRNEQRGLAAIEEITQGEGDVEARKRNANLLIGDCGVKADVERIVKEFEQSSTQLDALIVNAGALAADNKVKLVPPHEDSSGPIQFEETYATHLLFGAYHLTNLLVPMLNQAPDPRVVMVSSGGMYNTKVPIETDANSTMWERMLSRSPAILADVANASFDTSFDGQMAYCYSKRAQVQMCERFADPDAFPDRTKIKFLSCHPGWVDTPGVRGVYGENPSMLKPLRTLWEGVHGIVWLATADSRPTSGIENGEFYLDGLVMPKHLASASDTTKQGHDANMKNGLMFGIASAFASKTFTRNTEAAIDLMMQKLDADAKR